MPTSAEDLERLQVSDREEWRRWLAANHATAPGVWLVTFKPATGKPRPTYAETIEEALCFGWIASAKRDATRVDRVAKVIVAAENRNRLDVTARRTRSR